MSGCIFCAIAAGTAPCHRIWEDEQHLAFLSIFPNTPGFSVVIPKQHYASYAFALDDAVLLPLVQAAKQVGLLLDRSFPDVGRTGMIFEGFGVDHVHAKLFPMHGTSDMSQWQPTKTGITEIYFERYHGYISSHDSARADDLQLAALAAHIRQQV